METNDPVGGYRALIVIKNNTGKMKMGISMYWDQVTCKTRAQRMKDWMI